MTRTKAILIASLVVMFAAGAAVGVLVSQARDRPHGPSWLTAELNLTDDQRSEMHQIWSEVMHAAGQGQWERRRALAQERDEAVAALLTEGQRPRYDEILQDYARKVEELGQERERAFEQAVERTKQILTPEQAAKYDELLKARRERAPGEPRRPPPWGMRPPRPPSSDQEPSDRPAPQRGE